MIVYDFILGIFDRFPSLWSGLPIPALLLLLLPLAIPFCWTLMQQFSEKYWRYEDRAKALDYALSHIRPTSRIQNYFNSYFKLVFLFDLSIMLFALLHDAPVQALLTPGRVLTWGIAWMFRFFIKHMKRSLQDRIKDDVVGWVRHKFNDILGICSDFFVLSFIADRPNCQATFNKVYIFPETKKGSLEDQSLGPLFCDPFYLKGAALVDDSSLFLFDGKDNIVIHTQKTLRNLLKLEFKPTLAAKDEGLEEVVAGLPYKKIQAKTHGTTWDCVKQVMAVEEGEKDSAVQYEREPFDDHTFQQYMPYMCGIFNADIPRVELFPEYVTKVESKNDALELYWHGNAGAPTIIPFYAREAGESITDQLQSLIRKHRRANLADKTITSHLAYKNIPTPATPAPAPAKATKETNINNASDSENKGISLEKDTVDAQTQINASDDTVASNSKIPENAD